MKFKEKVEAIARDLTSLEINTIQRDHITGQSMPDPRHALFDIASEYNRALNAAFAGDRREATLAGRRLSARFTQPAYWKGDTWSLEVWVRDEVSGEPLAGEAVTLDCLDCPVVGAWEGRVQIVAGSAVESQAGTTAAEAPLVFSGKVPVGADGRPRPGVGVKLEYGGEAVVIDLPLRRVRGELLTFHYLNRRANDCMPHGSDTVSEAWLVSRIEINAIRLASMLEGMKPSLQTAPCETNDYSRRHLNGDPESSESQAKAAPQAMHLGASDLVAIRKIWELGCEQILMQTVVQLDGDVVTRLAPRATAEDAGMIHSIHAQGVKVATESWQYLVESIGSFAERIAGVFFK